MSKTNSKGVLWILLIFLMLVTAILVRATTLVPMSFEELTRSATAIARVRCVSVHSAWDGGEIWTESRFALLEDVKPDAFGADQRVSAPAGAAGAAASQDHRALEVPASHSILLRQLGGSIAGMHSRVEGIPEFKPGEEAYLFLWRRSGEPYRVLGWAQGTFRVLRDQRSGAARVTQDSAVAVFHEEEREFLASGIRNMPLSTFQQKLRRSLNASTP